MCGKFAFPVQDRNLVFVLPSSSVEVALQGRPLKLYRTSIAVFFLPFVRARDHELTLERLKGARTPFFAGALPKVSGQAAGAALLIFCAL